MPRCLRKKYPGAKYHLTNRGNGRAPIFYANDDRLRFLDQLFSAAQKDSVLLYAYCLMKNHFHLFVETPLANVDRFADRLGTAYAMYFRYKHYRPGHCFQGRYKAPLVQGDDYIARLTRYIHLNPICTDEAEEWDSDKKWSYLRSYPWSSLHGYLSAGSESDLVDYRWLDGFAGEERAKARRAYSRYMRRQVGMQDEVLAAPMKASRYAIGDEAFVASVEEWVRRRSEDSLVVQDVVRPSPERVSLDVIRSAVTDVFSVPEESLHARYRRGQGLPRAVFIEFACRLGQVTQREVAAYLGSISEHTVGKARQGLRAQLQVDPQLRKRVAKVARCF